MTNDHDLEQRIERCEIAVAHVTKVNDDLSEIIARQDVIIARLEKKVEMLLLREAEREAQGVDYVADLRPPHW